MLLGAPGEMAAMGMDPYSGQSTTETWKKVVNLPDSMDDRTKADRHAEIEKGWNT